MNYTDRDALVATQIAYYDFDKSAEGKTVSEALRANKEIHRKLVANLNDADSEYERIRAQEALKLYEELSDPNSKYGQWVIKDVRDHNKETGFYGCVIETDDNSAIIAFRGSESSKVNADGSIETDPVQVVHDWIESDFGLLGSTQTRQQQEAAEYMEYITRKYDYDEYITTGHSLGGNLAVHAAISAPDNMKEKIKNCYSMDGPGFSDEYIIAHQSEIAKLGADKIIHYQWSAVGALLFGIPGEKRKTVEVKEPVRDKVGGASLQRHDTCFVEIDENGNFVEGRMDPFATLLSDLSKRLELCFAIALPVAIAIASYKVVTQVIEKIKKWLQENSVGNRYANANPDIKINTGTMLQYAQRLESVSRRAKTLDRSMNSYYWHLLIEWDAIPKLAALLKAEFILDFAYRLDNCSRYLRDTANDFEKAEQSIISDLK